MKEQLISEIKRDVELYKLIAMIILLLIMAVVFGEDVCQVLERDEYSRNPIHIEEGQR